MTDHTAKGLPTVGFGLAKMKVEGEIIDPDDMDWEHEPHEGNCVTCAIRYHKWKAQYLEQEARKAEVKNAPR